MIDTKQRYAGGTQLGYSPFVLRIMNLPRMSEYIFLQDIQLTTQFLSSNFAKLSTDKYPLEPVRLYLHVETSTTTGSF